MPTNREVFVGLLIATTLMIAAHAVVIVMTPNTPTISAGKTTPPELHRSAQQ